MGVVGGALGGAAVLVCGAGPLQAGLGGGLRFGGLVGQFPQADLPGGAVAQPGGEAGEGVGGAAGALRGLLPLLPYAGGLGGGLVGLGPYGAGVGEGRRGGFRGLPCGGGPGGEFAEHAGRAVGAPRPDAGGQGAVAGEAGGEGADLLVAGGGAGAQGLPFLVGGVLVVHGRVRRDEEHVAAVVGGLRDGGEEGGGGADGDG